MQGLQISAMQDSFNTMLPGVAIAVLSSAIWLFLCRWYYRKEDATWRASLELNARTGSTNSIVFTLERANSGRRMVARGKPSDRLFIVGMMIAGMAGLLLVALILIKL